jgi:hypothetical protein
MPISTINQNGLNAPLTLTAPVLGTPASINLSNATSLGFAALPTGSVLQVVSVNIIGGGSTTSTSFVNTNLTASITPLKTTSKIFVIFNQFMGIQNGGGQCRIDFNLKLTGTATSDLLGYYYYGTFGATPGEQQTVIGGSYLYSIPSAGTYTFTTQVRKANGSAGETGTINYGSYAVSSGNTITLMEIAA